MSGRNRTAELSDDEPVVMSALKRGALLPVSTDMLMDEGLIPDTRPARPRRTPVRVTSWSLARDVARSRARDAVAGARLRAGSWIAGVDLADLDDERDEEDW